MTSNIILARKPTAAEWNAHVEANRAYEYDWLRSVILPFKMATTAVCGATATVCFENLWNNGVQIVTERPGFSLVGLCLLGSTTMAAAFGTRGVRRTAKSIIPSNERSTHDVCMEADDLNALSSLATGAGVALSIVDCFDRPFYAATKLMVTAVCTFYAVKSARHMLRILHVPNPTPT